MREAWEASKYQKETLEEDWEAARRLHGHLGPWMALGMKAGAEALRRLGARPHFGLRARIGCHLETPVSCLIDGVQWMTGATYGKRNLVAEESEHVWIEVTRNDTGACVRFDLREGVPESMARWLDTLGDEPAAMHVYAQPVGDLFAVTEEPAAPGGRP